MKIVTLLGLGALLSIGSGLTGCAAQTSPSSDPAGRQASQVDTQPAPAPTQTAPTPAPAPAPSPVAACTPITASNGSANPASVYCTALGYELAGEQCTFPDATSCEEWSFYRGECGQAHSFCNLHGGTVATKTEDMGTWTATYALCTLPGGQQCHEDAFARSCTCE
ncbi:MAG: hypothetical protein JWO86_6307 [Myxococcaceae bacterium]|nr:hypothetical protein [Myxococcaceae bacterium]